MLELVRFQSTGRSRARPGLGQAVLRNEAERVFLCFRNMFSFPSCYVCNTLCSHTARWLQQVLYGVRVYVYLSIYLAHVLSLSLSFSLPLSLPPSLSLTRALSRLYMYAFVRVRVCMRTCVRTCLRFLRMWVA